LKIQELEGGFNNEPHIEKKKKAKFKKRFSWIKFIVISMLFVGCTILFALSPVFNISGIEVHGLRNCSKEAIIQSSGIVTGVNGFKYIGSDMGRILSLRYGKAEIDIARDNAYVKRAVVRFLPPGKVNIDIIERTPVCLIPYLGTNLVVDNEQYVLTAVGEQKSKETPVVNGIRFGNYEVGKKLKIENADNFKRLLELLEALKQSDKIEKLKLMNLINYIDVNDLSQISIFVDSRIIVNFGELQDISYKINVLKQIMLKNLKKDEKGLIDFTMGQNPVFIPK
jgi:cell division protein FtsQ